MTDVVSIRAVITSDLKVGEAMSALTQAVLGMVDALGDISMYTEEELTQIESSLGSRDLAEAHLVRNHLRRYYAQWGTMSLAGQVLPIIDADVHGMARIFKSFDNEEAKEVTGLIESVARTMPEVRKTLTEMHPGGHIDMFAYLIRDWAAIRRLVNKYLQQHPLGETNEHAKTEQHPGQPG